MSRAAYLPLPSTPCGFRSGLRPSVDGLLCPLLTSAARSGRIAPPQSRFRDKRQISRGKLDRLPHATAGFTTSAFDGYGLRGHLPARPTPYASDPVLVHRLVRLLHASFRPSVAGTPLRFAMTSPPSGCQGDFHPRAVEHARHTRKTPALPGDIYHLKHCVDIGNVVSGIRGEESPSPDKREYLSDSLSNSRQRQSPETWQIASGVGSLFSICR